MVITHARALLAKDRGVTVVPGDLRQPAAILGDAARSGGIELGRPVCILLVAVLHFTDAATAKEITATLADTIAPGSYLVISVATADNPAMAEDFRRAYTAAPGHTHTPEQISQFLGRLNLVPPGIGDAHAWVPNVPMPNLPPRPLVFLAGVGRKPSRPAR